MLVARRRKHCCAPSIASGPDGQPFVCSVSCWAKVGVRIRLHEEPASLALPVHSSPPFTLLTETALWLLPDHSGRLTGHQDAQGRESEESPKTAPGNNGTGRHDAGRNACTTASAAPLSTSPAASGCRRSTRRRSTRSVGRSRRMGGRRGAPPPRPPTPSPRMVCHPAEAAPGRAARRRHWPRCLAAWRSVGGRAHSLGPAGGPMQGRHWPLAVG